MSKKLPTLAAAALVAALTASCSTVTLRDSGKRRALGDPQYSESKPYFLLGIIGEHAVDGKQVCGGKTPVQMQAVSTFGDRFLTFLTLGIYAPRTAKVWCQAGGA
jgi:hypothetical protein